MPTEEDEGVSGGCCRGALGRCDPPDLNNNGLGVDAALALCQALGYTSGVLLRSTTSSICPEVTALSSDGLSWGSDFLDSPGAGQMWQCTGFAVGRPCCRCCCV